MPSLWTEATRARADPLLRAALLPGNPIPSRAVNDVLSANRRQSAQRAQDGPKTENGKRRSRRNAFRHGLTAETVIEVLEDTEDYRGFEAAIIADYDARTAVERELVLRLASLLWRIRRATSIETGLLQIQAEILRARQNVCEPVSESEHKLENSMDGVIEGTVRPSLRNLSNGSCDDYRTNAFNDQCEKLTISPENAASTWRELTYCFLRLANLDNGAFDRIGRYEACLWRQIAQTLSKISDIAKRSRQIRGSCSGESRRGCVRSGRASVCAAVERPVTAPRSEGARGGALTAYGMVQDRVLVVAYTQRGARVRIISARLAEPRERRRYHEETS